LLESPRNHRPKGDFVNLPCRMVETRGRSAPLSGAEVAPPRGGNLAFFPAAHPVSSWFLRSERRRPARKVLRLDSDAKSARGLYGRVRATDKKRGTGLYGYRVGGHSIPARGCRFDGDKSLLDPYCRGVVVPKKLQPRNMGTRQRGDKTRRMSMTSVVIDPMSTIGKVDSPLCRADLAETII